MLWKSDHQPQALQPLLSLQSVTVVAILPSSCSMLNLHCESNSRFQADDRLIVLSVSVGKDSVGSLKTKISP
jgi:hypothetical protein